MATAWKGGMKKAIIGIANKANDPAKPPFAIPWRKTEITATT